MDILKFTAWFEVNQTFGSSLAFKNVEAKFAPCLIRVKANLFLCHTISGGKILPILDIFGQVWWVDGAKKEHA